MKDIALITLHGGCFTGGNSTWDKEQTQLLKEIGFNVYQLEFDKTSLSVCLEDIRNQVKDIKQNYKKVIVLGRSSGGYMAKYLFEEKLFDKAIYLAPIFDPILRGKIIPKLGKTQQPFFTNSKIIPIPLHNWDMSLFETYQCVNLGNFPKNFD
jgi:esterase/lipase